MSADSQQAFTTSNYGITTTSEVEWWFVVDPEAGLKQLEDALKELGCEEGSYPIETINIEKSEHMRGAAGMQLLVTALRQLHAKNAELAKRGEVLLVDEEVIGGCLYTGPTFVKYNLALRAMIATTPSFMKDDFEKKTCKGNRYTTTIHVVNSLIVKCSKLTTATKVYRGSARGLLPKPFWEPNAENVRGGVDGG